MANEEHNENCNHKTSWSIAIVFFSKVSAWIIAPAIAIVIANIITKRHDWPSYIIMIVAAIAALISFYGIYRESVDLINRHDI